MVLYLLSPISLKLNTCGGIRPLSAKRSRSSDVNEVFNDLTLIDQIDKLVSLSHKSYSQAQVNRPQDTIQLKNPRHNFRSYFKITKLTDEQKTHLTGFLLNQKTVRLSPALDEWIVGPFNRTQDYFFIDHNEMSWLTMLGLVRPGLVRKTQQIIQAK
jgi:hypothetical protein